MCLNPFKRKQPNPPQITEMVLSSKQIALEIQEMGLQYMYPVLLDYHQNYHYCARDNWNKVIKHINTAFTFPKYVSARKDCDDFAVLFKGLVSACFGLNACAIAIGDSPEGQHAFNLVRAEDGWYVVEPQHESKAELWPLEGDHGYVPEYVLV